MDATGWAVAGLALALALRLLALARVAPPPGELDHRDALAVAVAALAPRIAGAVTFAASPLAAWPLVDAAYYEEWARGLAAGWDPYPVFGVDPLYAYALGGLYALFGAHWAVPLALGAALGTASALLAHRLTARLATRPVALLVGLAAALHGPALAYDLLRLKSSLALFLTLATLETAVRAAARGPGWTLAPGAALALATLNGAQSLALAPALIVSAVRRPRPAVRIALLLAPALAAIGWTWAHNARGGDPVPLHAGSGMILWASNNPRAWGRLTALPYVRQDTRFEVADYTAEASRRAGRALKGSEASAYWRAEAIEAWRAEPWRAVRLAVTKLGLLLNAYEWPDNYDFRALSWMFPHLALAPGRWGLVVPLALVGLALALAGAVRPGARLIAASAVLMALPFLVTYSNARLRLPLLACAWPLAALALDRIARGRPLVPLVSVLVFAAAVLAPTPRVPLAPGLFGVAEASRLAGQTDSAVELYGLALKIDPDHPGALTNLGNLALAAGRPMAAVNLLERSAAVRPGPAAAYNLGNAYRRAGRPRDALAAYERARGGPIPDALVELKAGLALAEAGDAARGLELLARAVPAAAGGGAMRATLAERIEGHRTLARLLEGAGRGAEAAAERSAADALVAELKKSAR
jgi:tetratricopeptide (TPR) repeat protein